MQNTPHARDAEGALSAAYQQPVGVPPSSEAEVAKTTTFFVILRRLFSGEMCCRAQILASESRGAKVNSRCKGSYALGMFYMNS
jgi:hypothetical protein